MKRILDSFSNWLFGVTEPGKKLRSERDSLIAMIVKVREQYWKFGILSPSVEGKVDEVIDEIRGSLPPHAKRKLLEEVLRFNDIHTLPPGDYKRAVEQNDILRLTNERLLLSNEDLRLSNDRLLREIEELRSKAAGEGNGTETV